MRYDLQKNFLTPAQAAAGGRNMHIGEAQAVRSDRSQFEGMHAVYRI